MYHRTCLKIKMSDIYHLKEKCLVVLQVKVFGPHGVKQCAGGSCQIIQQSAGTLDAASGTSICPNRTMVDLFWIRSTDGEKQ